MEDVAPAVFTAGLLRSLSRSHTWLTDMMQGAVCVLGEVHVNYNSTPVGRTDSVDWDRGAKEKIVCVAQHFLNRRL